MLGLKWLPGLRHRPLLSTTTANIPGEYSSLNCDFSRRALFSVWKYSSEGSAPHSLFYFNNDGSCGPGEILEKFFLPPPLSRWLFEMGFSVALVGLTHRVMDRPLPSVGLKMCLQCPAESFLRWSQLSALLAPNYPQVCVVSSNSRSSSHL